MSPPPAPRPAAPSPPRTSDRVAELARDLQERAAELVEDFRRSDRFFKMRVGIVGSWALLALITLWLACGSFGPTNALGANVQLKPDAFMGVQLLVRNESNQTWEDVVLTLDDAWQYAHRPVRPHDPIVVPMSAFKKADEAPPRDYKPRSLVISCRQGTARFELQ